MPFLAISLLTFYYLPRTIEDSKNIKPFICDFIFIFILIFFGLIMSLYNISPFIVKLTLPRSSDIILTIGGLIIIKGIWDDIFIHKQTLQKFLSINLILSPFFNGLPATIAIIKIYFNFLSNLNNEYKNYNKSLLFFTTFLLILILFYYYNGLTNQGLLPYMSSRIAFYSGIILIFYILFTKYLNINNITLQLLFIIFLSFKSLVWFKESVIFKGYNRENACFMTLRFGQMETHLKIHYFLLIR